MRFFSKVKAGALQFVLFIGAIVAVLLMAFILLSHTHALFDRKTDSLVQLVKASNLGLNTSLNKPVTLGNDVELQHNFELPINLSVGRDFWGIFEKRSVQAMHGNTKVVKTALVGGKEMANMPALFVSDKQRPVIIAGNAMIRGTAYLPEQGIKMGNIHGNSYHRDQLIYGKKEVSTAGLPPLSSEVLAQLAQLTNANYNPMGEVMTLTPKIVLKNSFRSPLKIIRDRVVYLRDAELAGNIVVAASDKIIVEQGTLLQDVILLAPEIVIKDWVNGYFQAIASKSISVGKKCNLAYPTALVVHKKEKGPKTTPENKQSRFKNAPSVYIDSYTVVKGMVLALENTAEAQYTAQIKIDDNAKIVGEVYCTKNLELKGQVNGSVMTDAFVAVENGGVYQNHLYNGTINGLDLSKAYVGLLMGVGERQKRIMKWLY